LPELTNVGVITFDQTEITRQR